MPNQSINKNTPPVNHLYDTWNIKDGVGYWCVIPYFEFTDISIQKINLWYVDTIAKTLNAFSNLARVWKISFRSNPKTYVNQVSFEWKSEQIYEEFIDEILKAIRQFSHPIYELDLEVDLLVYVRTQESPNKPILGWTRNNDIANFSMCLDLEDRDTYLFFKMDHTLFYPFCYRTQEDNSELFSLNQPLLENALKQWEDKFGEILGIEGLKGIFKYGFLPEEQWNLD